MLRLAIDTHIITSRFALPLLIRNPADWYVGPSFLEPVGALVVIEPVMSIYVFHALGIPGLLEHQGHCGWGMCNPTPFGVVFLVLFWLLAFWLAAWGLAYLVGRR